MAAKKPAEFAAAMLSPRAASMLRTRGRIYGGDRSMLRTLTPDRVAAIFDSARTRIDEQIVLADLMEEADDHLRGTLQLRRLAVQRMKKNIEPGDAQDDRSIAAADAARSIVDQPWFDAMCAALLRAIFLQWSAVEVFYRPDPSSARQSSDGRELVMPCGFRAVESRRWDFDDWGEPRFRRCIETLNDFVTPGAASGRFILHSYDATATPGHFAIVRSVARLWILGRLDITQWGQEIDQWGTPFTHFQYPEGMSETDVQTMVDAFLQLAAARVAATPQGVNLVFHGVPDNAPHATFQEFYRRSVSRLLLGQDSSQMAMQGQTTGATLQGNVRDDIRDADAQLLDGAINAHLLAPWTAWNFGADVAPPRLSHIFERAADPTARASVFEAAGRMGLRVLASQVYNELGLQMPDGTPEIITITAAPAAGGFAPRMPFAAKRSDTNEIADLFEPHRAAIEKLVAAIDREGGSDAAKFAALQKRLPALLKSIDSKALEAYLHEATFAAYGAGRINMARATKERNGNG